MTAREIIDIYLSFFEKRGHTKIAGAPLVPLHDPTTLFTSSGMQPLITYLLGESHPAGNRLVDVQNVFRAVDIEEVGDDRHTTFFRMLGNWSLGDYFKEEQIAWMWELYTKGFGLDPKKLFVSIFAGDPNSIIKTEGKEIPMGLDATALIKWQELFKKANLSAIAIDMTNNKVTQAEIDAAKIFQYAAKKNWWSRSGVPTNMPAGEPGGPDTEMFYDFGVEHKFHENSQWNNEVCHPNCDCGRFWEIGNSVFIQYIKQQDGTFISLPKQNVDFGGGLERIIGATENQSDMFQTSLFKPTITSIEKQTGKSYGEHRKQMQIIADHLGGGLAIAANGIKPANKDQGYILRRLIRRSMDNLLGLNKSADVAPILETIVGQYKDTDPYLVEKFEEIKYIILEEVQKYERTRNEAKRFIEKKYRSVILEGAKRPIESQEKDPIATLQDDKRKIGDELMGVTEISADDAFLLYTTHGLSPTQIKSLGYTFNDQKFAELMEAHQNLSRTQSAGKFKGGLADTQELTIKGHTATHLLHQAIRDLLGTDVHQSGSNITVERLRFDFNFDRKLTDEEIKSLEQTVNEKIKEDLPIRFEMMPLQKAKDINAIGLFGDKYEETVKVYFIGGSNPHSNSLPKGERDEGRAYSIEFCGGPHVAHTGEIQSFKITKQEKLGQGLMRLYAVAS